MKKLFALLMVSAFALVAMGDTYKLDVLTTWIWTDGELMFDGSVISGNNIISSVGESSVFTAKVPTNHQIKRWSAWNNASSTSTANNKVGSIVLNSAEDTCTVEWTQWSGSTGKVRVSSGSQSSDKGSINSDDTTSLWNVPYYAFCLGVEFEWITYTINFVGGSGSTGSTYAMQNLVYTNKVVLSECGFEKTGYTFAGWKQSGGSAIFADQTTVSGDSFSGLTYQNKEVTLEAQWSARTYTIKFDSREGEPVKDIVATYDKTYLAPNATRVGYIFEGWAKGPNTRDISYKADADLRNLVKDSAESEITFYAVWTPVSYMIVYTLNGSTITDGVNLTTNRYDVNLKVVTPTPKEGYVFDGWLVGKADHKTAQYSVDEGANWINITNQDQRCGYLAKSVWFRRLCTENWGNIHLEFTARPKHTVTVGIAEGSEDRGTVERGGDYINGNVYIDGNTATLSAKPNDGYSFEKWSDGDLNAERQIVVTNNEPTNFTYKASFTGNVYQVVFYGNGGTNTVGGDVKVQDFTYGTPKALDANEFNRDGYKFGGWTLDPQDAKAGYTNEEKVATLTKKAGGRVQLFALWVRTVKYNEEINKWLNCYTLPFETNMVNGGNAWYSADGGGCSVSNEACTGTSINPRRSTLETEITESGEIAFNFEVTLPKAQPNESDSKYKYYRAPVFSISNNADVCRYENTCTTSIMRITSNVVFNVEATSRNPNVVNVVLDGGWYYTDYSGNWSHATIKSITWTPSAIPSEGGIGVTFRLNDGSEAPADIYTNITKMAKSKYGELPNAERPGYDFIGWFNKPDGGSQIYSTDEIANTTLYAHWEQLYYTVDIDGEVTTTNVYGQVINASAVASNIWGETNVVCRGWIGTGDVSADGVGNEVTFIVTTNSTLRWLYMTNYWVSVTTTSAGKVTLTDASGVVIGNELWAAVGTNLTAVATAGVGYSFAGWSDGEKAATRSLSVEHPISLKALFDSVPVDPVDPVDPVVDPVDPVDPVVNGDIKPLTTEDVFVARTYDGYLYKGTNSVLMGTIQVKSARPKAKGSEATSVLTITIQLANETKKITAKGTYYIGSTTLQTFGVNNRGNLKLLLGSNGITGSFEGYTIEGVPNSAAESSTEYIGCYNVVADEGSFALSVAKKGKVKVTGTTAAGKKVSVSVQLLVGEKSACIPVVVPKYGLAFMVWLGDSVVVEGLTDEVAGSGTMGLMTGSQLRFVDKAMMTRMVGDATYAAYLPDGAEVKQSGSKWVVMPDETGKAMKAGKLVLAKDGTIDQAKSKIDGYNVAALKLSYTAKTGVFKGSFKAYYNDARGKLKNVTFAIAGVMVDGVGYGTATNKKLGSVEIVISK